MFKYPCQEIFLISALMCMNFLTEQMNTVFAQCVSKQYWEKLNKICNKKNSLPGYEQVDTIIDVFHFPVSRVLGGCRPYITLGLLPTFLLTLMGSSLQKLGNLESYFYLWNEIILYGIKSPVSLIIHQDDTNANNNYVSVLEKN